MGRTGWGVQTELRSSALLQQMLWLRSVLQTHIAALKPVLHGPGWKPLLSTHLAIGKCGVRWGCAALLCFCVSRAACSHWKLWFTSHPVNLARTDHLLLPGPLYKPDFMSAFSNPAQAVCVQDVPCDRHGVGYCAWPVLFSLQSIQAGRVLPSPFTEERRALPTVPHRERSEPELGPRPSD